MSHSVSPPARPSEPEAGNVFYNQYDLAEDLERVAYHYEQDPEFFLTIMSSRWHNYSCSIWGPGDSVSEAEERKLDQMAAMLELEPGMRVLDVGCGWGGPLVYLCQRYGVTGHGITISPRQIPTARARAARHGVNCQFDLLAWQNLPERPAYDGILTDEVIVHFNDLDGFLGQCHRILRPGRILLNKELHLARSEFGRLGRASEHVNKIYGYTGNYRTLHNELALLEKNGFLLREIRQIPLSHYHQTLDHWLKNLFEHRERLRAITSPAFYKDFRAYLKAVRYIFSRTEHMNLHMVSARREPAAA